MQPAIGRGHAGWAGSATSGAMNKAQVVVSSRSNVIRAGGERVLRHNWEWESRIARPGGLPRGGGGCGRVPADMVVALISLEGLGFWV